MFECECGKEAGKPEDISFIYKGLRFFISKDKSKCIECVQKEHIEKFERYGKELVELEDGNLKVSWQYYLDNIWNIEKKSRMTTILESLEILSYNPEGNWGIKGYIGNKINPEGYHFTRKEDVLTFARLRIRSGIQYIYHIDETISKSQVLEGV